LRTSHEAKADQIITAGGGSVFDSGYVFDPPVLGRISFAQVALMLFLISFWVFRIVERREHAERIVRSKAEYLGDGSQSHG
jgi:hypothetical protein